MFFSKLVWVSCRDFSDSVFVGPVALVDAPSPFGCLCTLCCFLLILIIIKTLVVDIVDIVDDDFGVTGEMTLESQASRIWSHKRDIAQ